jgi:hypothetical protein
MCKRLFDAGLFLTALFALLIFLPLAARAQGTFSKTIYVFQGKRVNAVTTWYYLNCDTSLGLGSYSVAVAPNFGDLTFADLNGPVPGCPKGSPSLPAAAAFYKWTNTTTDETSDYFQLTFILNGGVAEYIDVTVKKVVMQISGLNTLWWFNGERPQGYPTQTTLTASLANAGPYTWTSSSLGTGQVVFPNGATTYTTTTNSVVVSAANQSASENDVVVTVTSPAGASAPFGMTVRAPNSLAPYVFKESNTNAKDEANSTFGYTSSIYYSVVDQLKAPLPPTPVPINERWDSDLFDDYPGTNWIRGDACGDTKVCQTLNPTLWRDMIDGQCIIGSPKCYAPKPVALPPPKNLGDVAVDHWDGHWSVGSGIPGKGVSVQTNTWQKYQDHARHTNVVSPP